MVSMTKLNLNASSAIGPAERFANTLGLQMIGSLQNYTTYSIQNGLKYPESWAEEASRLNHDFLAISDRDSMGGWPKLQRACDEHGLKPIFGIDLTMVTDRGAKGSQQEGSVLLYCYNEQGMRNLISINNQSQRRGIDSGGGFYHYPRVDLDLLSQFREGVLCVLPLRQGFASPTVELACLDSLEALANLYGQDFYLGIDATSHNEKWIEFLTNCYQDLPYKKVPLFNCHAPTEEMVPLLTMLEKIRRSTHTNRGRDPREVDAGELPDLASFDYVAEYMEEAMEGMEELVSKVDVRIPWGDYFMPKAKLRTESVEQDLVLLIGEGWKKKLDPDCNFDVLSDFQQLLSEDLSKKPFEHLNKGEAPDSLEDLEVYYQRLVEEYQVISDLGYDSYFHIVHEFCDISDKLGHSRGIARGSAGGSLLAYLVGITKLDPIRHQLFFERFINKDRNDFPDIDLDFSIAGRDGVKQEISKRYGKNKVLNIGTYGTLDAISAIKAVVKASDSRIPDNKGNMISYLPKNLDSQIGRLHVKQTLKGMDRLQALREHDSFEKFYQTHSGWIHQWVAPLFGSISQKGVHAAGILILPEDMDKVMPCFSHSEKGMVTMWRDSDCEGRGFPKFDVLASKNLDVIDGVYRELREKGIEPPTFEEIPLDYAEVFKSLCRNETSGIFQLGTYVYSQYIPKLLPTQFEHISAALALNRPGPMDANTHLLFADIKNGRKEPEYKHEDLKPILGETYGLLVYQEQMMAVVKEIGGLTGSETDHVRKACGKKKIKEMEKWEVKFKDGGLKNGYEEDLLNELWDQIVAFAEYSFNKSHSVAYSMVAYWQMYIKVKYSGEYWAARLQFAPTGKNDKHSVYLLKEKAETQGMKFVFPTVSSFRTRFNAVDKDTISWPVTTISGIGQKATRTIEEIGATGFTSLRDYYATVGKDLNSNISVNLIKAGFFDELGHPREIAEQYYRLRAEFKNKHEEVPEYLTTDNKFKWELMKREAYGTSSEPWKSSGLFHENVQEYKADEMNRVADRSLVFIGGYVKNIYVNKDRRGGWYASVIVVDTDEEHRVKIWSDVWSDNSLDIPDENGRRKRISKGQLVELICRKSSWNDKPQLTFEKQAYVRIIADVRFPDRY